MESSTTTFDIFLSHNSRDKDVVRLLAEHLRRRDLEVWLDEEQLVPGQPWQEAIEATIQDVRAAAVLIGPDGMGPWEVPEMRACLLQVFSRGLPVIPILLPGAPEKPEIPSFLRLFTWVDLRSGLSDEGLTRIKCGVLGIAPASVLTLSTLRGGVASTSVSADPGKRRLMAKLMNGLLSYALRKAIERFEDQQTHS